jgi:acetyl esterase/lipase
VRTILVALLIFACAGALLPWYPFSSELLWPVGMVARELWPWLLVANSLGVVLASRRWRPLQLVFLGGATAALWPLVQIHLVKRDFARDWAEQGFAGEELREAELGALLKNAFGGYDGTLVEPEKLEMGILYYRPRAPDGGGARPILIAIHGGSWQHGGARENADFTSRFANAGWAVFSLEYRLAPQFVHPAQIEDVRTSIGWIYDHARELGADPERIALAGRSAGGHLAMLAAYSNDAVPIRAVVNYYGPADLAEIWRERLLPDPLNRNEKVEVLLGGPPDQRPDTYRDASPSSYLRPGLPPTLHVHGAHDHIVGVALARQFHERLLASGSRSLFLELPWSDHSFDFVYFGPANTLSLAYVDSFLDATTATRAQAGSKRADRAQ